MQSAGFRDEEVAHITLLALEARREAALLHVPPAVARSRRCPAAPPRGHPRRPRRDWLFLR